MELDIRVGKIISAEEFPEIKKPSYLLNIDFGNRDSRLRTDVMRDARNQPEFSYFSQTREAG